MKFLYIQNLDWGDDRQHYLPPMFVGAIIEAGSDEEAISMGRVLVSDQLKTPPTTPIAPFDSAVLISQA